MKIGAQRAQRTLFAQPNIDLIVCDLAYHVIGLNTQCLWVTYIPIPGLHIEKKSCVKWIVFYCQKVFVIEKNSFCIDLLVITFGTSSDFFDFFCPLQFCTNVVRNRNAARIKKTNLILAICKL